MRVRLGRLYRHLRFPQLSASGHYETDEIKMGTQAPAMNQVLQDLVQVLQLEPLEVNLFRGQSRNLGGKSVFGGQVLGQALVAANHTVEAGRRAHSLHAYFLRPGDMEASIVYEVERIRDGRSFATRRVKAVQHGEPIFSTMISYQIVERGHEHQTPMPAVPPPEQLLSQVELRERWIDQCPPKLRVGYLRDLAIEFKPVAPMNPFAPERREPQQYLWFRAAGPLPGDPVLHQCVLTYATDFNLLATALYPHGLSWFQPNMVVASIDHALWFHHDCRVDDWLLYAMDSPGAQGGRGFSRGLIYNRDGLLVASVAQESLMRDTSLK
jgi:acyl-CoA thioesterase-2